MLPSPVADRTPIGTRQIVFNGFARPDGLWDIEAALTDTKRYDFHSEQRNVAAGEPIHHLLLRITIDSEFVIRAIETDMDSAPFGQCQGAGPTMQKMVGCRMGAGWRATIDRHIGGAHGCAHLRELLFNAATAAFQTVPHYMETQRGAPLGDPTTPPFYMGRCLAWDFNGDMVREHYPQFIGWAKSHKAKPPG